MGLGEDLIVWRFLYGLRVVINKEKHTDPKDLVLLLPPSKGFLALGTGSNR